MADDLAPALTPEIVDASKIPHKLKAPRLSPQKRRFCETFVSTWNIKKAIDASGITKVERCLSGDKVVMGNALLAQREVSNYLQFLTQSDPTDLPVPRGKIRSELAALAFHDASDAIEYGPKDDDGYRPVKRIRIDKIDGRAISRLKIKELVGGKQEIDIFLHPKVAPLVKLGEEQRMFGDEGAVSLPNINIQINIGEK